MLEKILYADSGTGHTQEMLKALLELPAMTKSNITILHVVKPEVTTDALTAKWEEGSKLVADVINNLPMKWSCNSLVTGSRTFHNDDEGLEFA